MSTGKLPSERAREAKERTERVNRVRAVVDDIPHPADRVEPWGEFDPYEVSTLPPFPTEVLPPVVRNWVQAQAAALEVPEDLAAMVALGVLSAGSVGRLGVTIKESTGFTALCNLYVAPIARSGERKSALFAAATVGLARAGQLLRDDYDHTAKSTAEVMSKRAARLRSDAVRTDDTAESETLIEQARQMDRNSADIDPGAIPRLWTGDITAEALEDLLMEQQGRAAVMSDEGGGLDTFGRYSTGKPNLDAVLKGHDGGMLQVIRQSRTVNVEQAVMTICMTFQPAQLATLSEPYMKARGLSARFLYAWPKSSVGRRRITGQGIILDVRDSWRDLTKNLPLSLWSSREVRMLTLTSDAYDRLEAFHDQLEPRLGETGDLFEFASWGSKLVGQVASIAGLLHICDDRWQDQSPEISAVTMRSACNIGEYLIPHAVAAMRVARFEGPSSPARRILGWMDRNDCWDQFTLRDVYHELGMASVDGKDAAVELVGRGHIRAVRDEATTGGRPSLKFEIRPGLQQLLREEDRKWNTDTG